MLVYACMYGYIKEKRIDFSTLLLFYIISPFYFTLLLFLSFIILWHIWLQLITKFYQCQYFSKNFKVSLLFATKRICNAEFRLNVVRRQPSISLMIAFWICLFSGTSKDTELISSLLHANSNGSLIVLSLLR